MSPHGRVLSPIGHAARSSISCPRNPEEAPQAPGILCVFCLLCTVDVRRPPTLEPPCRASGPAGPACWTARADLQIPSTNRTATYKKGRAASPAAKTPIPLPRASLSFSAKQPGGLGYKSTPKCSKYDAIGCTRVTVLRRRFRPYGVRGAAHSRRSWLPIPPKATR